MKDAPSAAEHWDVLHEEVPAGKTVAGNMGIMMEGQPSAWTSYVSVEDADKTVDVAKEAGAVVFVEAMDVMDIGRMAVFADPTGAAIGISVLTAMLVAKEQIHQAYLVEHFSIFDAWRMSQAAPHMPGAPAFHFLQTGGGKEGLAMVYSIVQSQAAILAFNDIYRMLSFLAFAILPLYLVLRRAPMSTAQAGH